MPPITETNEQPSPNVLGDPLPADALSNGLNGGSDSALRELLHALQAVRVGDFSVRMAGDGVGLNGKISDAFNEIVAANQRMAQELERSWVRRWAAKARSGTGSHSGLPRGAWGEMERSINTLIDDLLWPTTEMTRTIRAVARGDLQQNRSARC